MITWSNFFLACIPIIAYLLIGRLIGSASRKAWIEAQEKRVQGRYHAVYEGPLPLTFYFFFPYQAFTRRYRIGLADFMLNRDGVLYELQGDELTYVRAHMLLWPLRILTILIMGTAAMPEAIRLRQSADRQIARLEKRRRKLRSRVCTAEDQLHQAGYELDELIKRRNAELKNLAFELAQEAHELSDATPKRQRPRLRPLSTEKQLSRSEKKRTDLN